MNQRLNQRLAACFLFGAVEFVWILEDLRLREAELPPGERASHFADWKDKSQGIRRLCKGVPTAFKPEERKLFPPGEVDMAVFVTHEGVKGQDLREPDLL